METRPGQFRRAVPSLVALVLISGLYALSRPPALAEAEAEELAHRFRFEKSPLPELPTSSAKDVREVHPSLHHVRGQISFVGAAVALGDLDGDGLPNDIVYVDPR